MHVQHAGARATTERALGTGAGALTASRTAAERTEPSPPAEHERGESPGAQQGGGRFQRATGATPAAADSLPRPTLSAVAAAVPFSGRAVFSGSESCRHADGAVPEERRQPVVPTRP